MDEDDDIVLYFHIIPQCSSKDYLSTSAYVLAWIFVFSTLCITCLSKIVWQMSEITYSCVILPLSQNNFVVLDFHILPLETTNSFWDKGSRHFHIYCIHNEDTSLKIDKVYNMFLTWVPFTQDMMTYFHKWGEYDVD